MGIIDGAITAGKSAISAVSDTAKALTGSATLDIEQLYENPEATVRLSHILSQTVFVSLITEDLQVAGSSNFTSPFEQYLSDKNNTLNQLTAAMNVAGFDFGSIQLKNLGNSISLWENSERPVFNIPMLFITTRTGGDTRRKAAHLSSFTYPITDSNEISLTNFVKPPGGYRIGKDGIAIGTWTLEIGTWFRATNLVLKQAPIVMSKEPTPDRQPLFAIVNCTLEPYRMISQSEYMGYFMEGPTDKDGAIIVPAPEEDYMCRVPGQENKSLWQTMKDKANGLVNKVDDALDSAGDAIGGALDNLNKP